MVKSSLPLLPSSIAFGTDGWRGILGVDFTLERLQIVAIAAAQELSYRACEGRANSKIIIGYDRRFLAAQMAEAIASAVRSCELEPVLTMTALPTPACSYAVVKHQALGALVVTASHNPPEWLGLKIKGPLGGSVEGDFTKAVEKRIAAGGINNPIEGKTERFDARQEHINFLKHEFDIPEIIKGLKKLGLNLIVDPMHGSAAGCIGDLFGQDEKGLISEIRSNCDPLFGGNPPEPLPKYINQLIGTIKGLSRAGKLSLGLVFDGDGDRIAAIDEKGRYCSTQFLMPLLIDHLAGIRKSPGCVLKTVSGCDLMNLVAESHGREVFELPVGFKYIAKEMQEREVLIGGEESGGIGFGSHIPERDALFTALVLLESIAEGGIPLGERLDNIQVRFGEVNFDRVDLFLDNMDVRKRFETFLSQSPPKTILDIPVRKIIAIDGIKLRLGQSYWIMFRFSGTEPLLRIYCEAPSKEEVRKTLDWAKKMIEDI
tara:strand:+ start:47028 stop:48488 length:1461 start_codon:yes stop_codon:yes gene_type:complete